MYRVISGNGKTDEPMRRIQIPTSANPDSVLCGIGHIRDRFGPYLLKMLLKRTATGNNENRSETISLLSQLSRNTFDPGGCHVILSRSTEAKQIHSKGKCMLKISILLFYFVPCDPAAYRTPVASIVSFSALHCSLAIWDGAHSMGWYRSPRDII